MANIEPMLRFEFSPAINRQECHDGYGGGILFLNGVPFWYSDTKENPGPVMWTWVDLLEHLAKIWPALIAEQAYPYEWMNNSVSHPGEMWDKAELRWSFQGDDVADTEEPVLYEFHNRHNLAAGWKGIAMPALYFLRVGNSVWLSPEAESPIRASFSDCMQSIESIGSRLADAFRDSENIRVVSAIKAWDKRQMALDAKFYSYATGLSEVELAIIERGQPRAMFWGVGKIDGWQSAAANDSEFLVAARMTKGILKPSAIASLIEVIRQIPVSPTPELDALAEKALHYLESCEKTYAHEAGYRLAEWLRVQLNLGPEEPFDVEQRLSSFGISITSAKFGTDHIDAMARLGRNGGGIIVNEDRAYSQKMRLRMTLAHELCHFLIDRYTALPVVEVLGGSVDLYVERRASAFAAELLLPRAAVSTAGDNGEVTLNGKLRYLQKRFEVSKTVACAQIFNSPEYSLLSRGEIEYIHRKLSSSQVKFSDEKILSQVI